MALSLLLLLALCITPRITSAFGFPYGSQPVRGVNLGGWLVLEARPGIYFTAVTFLTGALTAMDHPESIRQHRKRRHC